MIPLGVLASSYAAPVGGSGGVVLTYSGGISTIPTGTGTFTFTDVPIGDAAADRLVVLGISTRDSDVTAVTIGGISATVVGQVSANGDRAAFAFAAVPTGTTATITVTHAYGSQRVLIGVWAVSGFGTLAVTDHGGSAVNDADIALSTTAGDLVFAVSGPLTLNQEGNTCTWTGADEDYETDAIGTMESSGARTVATGATTTLSAYWSVPRFGATISPCYAIALA